MGDLYALDFDGVLCDSCGESSLSAVKVQNSLSLSLSLTKILCLFPEKSDTINFDHVLFFSYLCCFFFFFFECLQAARVRWPALFDGVDSTTEDWIVDQMYKVSELLCFYLFIYLFICAFNLYPCIIQLEKKIKLSNYTRI